MTVVRCQVQSEADEGHFLLSSSGNDRFVAVRNRRIPDVGNAPQPYGSRRLPRGAREVRYGAKDCFDGDDRCCPFFNTTEHCNCNFACQQVEQRGHVRICRPARFHRHGVRFRSETISGRLPTSWRSAEDRSDDGEVCESILRLQPTVSSCLMLCLPCLFAVRCTSCRLYYVCCKHMSCGHAVKTGRCFPHAGDLTTIPSQMVSANRLCDACFSNRLSFFVVLALQCNPGKVAFIT